MIIIRAVLGLYRYVSQYHKNKKTKMKNFFNK